MMVDKKMIDQLLMLPDEQLLQMVQLLMPGKMPGRLPDAVTMRRIRGVLEALTDGDLSRIATLVAVYQNVQ